jgi:tripartite-type tricarboxylate transporter receptor subunit TctC
MILAASTGHAADWVPKQPIHVIVGFAPGGTADIAARIAAEAIQKKTGHIVVVDSKTGALGYIALKSVGNAPPDGYTVGIGIMGSLAVGPVVPGTQIPLDLDRELKPICNLVGVPMALIARPTAPFKTVPELIAYAKANPGKVSYGSTGAGSTNQLGAELFAAEAGGLKLLHVPYRGGAPAIADVATGQIDIFFANISEIVGQISSGQVRALGIASKVPNPMAPDLPLLTRDMPTVEINNWFGLVGPAGLPPDIATSLAKLFLDAINDPASKPILASRGLVAIPQDGPAFQAQIAADRERWAKVVKQGNIRADNN